MPDKRTSLDFLRDNAVMASGAALILVVGTLTGTLTALGDIDNLVMTHKEHDVSISPLIGDIAGNSKAIEALHAWNRCARLEELLDTLEDRRWRIENQSSDAADHHALRDVDKDIERIERQFEALNCAEVLAG